MKSILLVVLLRSLIRYPQLVGDVWDEETRVRMEVRAKQLEWERIRLEQEVEQLARQQLLQLLSVAVLLLLLVVLWLVGWKSSLRRVQHEEEDHDANEEEVGNVERNEEEDDDNEEEDGVNREEENSDDGNEEEVGNAAVHEEDNVGNVFLNEAANAGNNDDVADAFEEENDREDQVGRTIMARIQWPVQDLRAGCEWTTGLMDNLTALLGRIFSTSFYPVLEQAIGVGSAFEGWSPRGQDVEYQVLIPMTPPRGHSFHLELDSAAERNFCVRVQLECTCRTEQQGEKVLCFLHQPEEELRSAENPSLLDTLCTGSYLDVHKTARWLYQLVRASWVALPQSRSWYLMLLPPRRSCQFKVTNGRESFWIEMLFGVRRGDSDIFVSSQPRDAHTPSTTWPETYAVAEMKFFEHIAKQAPPDALHLRCLQFLTGLPLGSCVSAYSMKTLVMHRLNFAPPSEWRRRDLLERLVEIIESLGLCVQRKRLNHFVLGNQRLPQDIRVPADVQKAEQFNNLFHHLAQQPATHRQAMHEYQLLWERFKRILLAED